MQAGGLERRTGAAAAARGRWTRDRADALGADPVAVLRHGPAAASASDARRIVSFLAVGDAGSILRWRPFSEGQRRPVPIYAVLGNHDYKTPESPRLERESIPEFIKNWSLPEQTAHTVELPGGVSLILVDSPLIARTRDTGEVRRELRKSSEPWRMLVAPARASLHRPLLRHRDHGLRSGRSAGSRRQRAPRGLALHRAALSDPLLDRSDPGVALAHRPRRRGVPGLSTRAEELSFEVVELEYAMAALAARATGQRSV